MFELKHITMPSPLTILKKHLKAWKIRKHIFNSVLDSRPIVLVYQMGKVASSSIYHSLKKYPQHCHTFHTHILTAKRIEAKVAKRSISLFNPDWRIQRSKDLLRNIIEPGHPAKVITLVRDPFARSISSFFEISSSVSKAPLDPVAAMHYLESAFFEETNLLHPDYWFDKEFNHALRLDIFDYPFNPEQGWLRFSKSPYEVLVLSIDLPDKEKAEQISKFVDIPGFEFERKNTSPPGGCFELYNSFKAHIRFPKDAIDKVLNTQYCRHFFDAVRRDALRERWQVKNTSSR